MILDASTVLRYSEYTQAISEITRNKTLGDLVNIVLVEPVGYYHFAHSYVRGNWSAEEESSFVLMTKCCQYVLFLVHLDDPLVKPIIFDSDIDLLCHWFSSTTPSKVSSFGSLTHFRKSKKPPSAGNVKRCIECPLQQGDCPYSATQSNQPCSSMAMITMLTTFKFILIP